MGRYSGKTCRLITMLLLTGSFFLTEIIVGYITNSIALVADSFHMLSDVVALIVGFASVRVSFFFFPPKSFLKAISINLKEKQQDCMIIQLPIFLNFVFGFYLLIFSCC